MAHYYCSTFSKGYAYRGLLLYNSLLSCDKDFHFYMISLDDKVNKLYKQMNLKNATIIQMSAVEREDNQLLAVKRTRNEQEYAWTSKASVMLYILNHFPATDHIIWLDGDTFFFSNPEPIFEEWGQYSIMLTEGRWTKDDDKHKVDKYGKYNTGFMGFRRDENAVQCLNWFRSRLIEWCYVKHENNLWSDQVYVNDWRERFNNVGVIKNMGVNVTPPMIMGSEVSNDGKFVYVDGDKLVFFHYSQFHYFDGNEFDLCGFVRYFSDDVLKWIYLPYIHACNDIMEQIRKVDQDFCRAASTKGKFITNYFNLEVNENAGEKFPNLCTLLTEDYLVQGLALYYSLKKYCDRFRLWILCIDDTTYNLLAGMNLTNVILISMDNIISRKLAKIRRERQAHEFCWTLKPVLVTYLLKNNYNLDSILYLDADLFFFKDVRNIYDDWEEHSVFLTKLRLSPKWKQRLGIYSAGLVGFKRDKTGMKCLRSWRLKCQEWCYDKQKNGLWGDQKYLDNWPQLYSGVKISENKGINAGSWNLRKGCKVHSEGGVIHFENTDLICFHFSGFKIINENEYVLCTWKRIPAYAKSIYSVYLDAIQKIIPQVRSLI